MGQTIDILPHIWFSHLDGVRRSGNIELDSVASLYMGCARGGERDIQGMPLVVVSFILTRLLYRRPSFILPCVIL